MAKINTDIEGYLLKQSGRRIQEILDNAEDGTTDSGNAIEALRTAMRNLQSIVNGEAKWYFGSDLAGTEGNTQYSYSSCPTVQVNDMYLNTSTNNFYRCVVAGSGSSAKWILIPISGSGTTIDEALSLTSRNPVENRTIAENIINLIRPITDRFTYQDGVLTLYAPLNAYSGIKLDDAGLLLDSNIYGYSTLLEMANAIETEVGNGGKVTKAAYSPSDVYTWLDDAHTTGDFWINTTSGNVYICSDWSARTWDLIGNVNGTSEGSGKGIDHITEYYCRSSSTTAPADNQFSTTVPTITSTYKYLWSYEEVTYTDNTTEKMDKRIIGAYGDKGDKGDTGARGATGSSGRDGDALRLLPIFKTLLPNIRISSVSNLTANADNMNPSVGNVYYMKSTTGGYDGIQADKNINLDRGSNGGDTIIRIDSVNGSLYEATVLLQE